MATTESQSASAAPASGVGEATKGGGAWFATTHWSVVLAAAVTSSPAARVALDKLCRAYWYPLYAFARRAGHAAHEAEDLTQEFFLRLLQRNDLATVSPELGRFRSFLLAAFKHFMADEWRRGQTAKRGGGRPLLSLDGEPPETRYASEPSDNTTPETLFERRWAWTVIERVLQRLQAEYATAGKVELFDQLKEFLSEKMPTAHAELAIRMGIGVSTVGVVIHRLRQRYRELLREEIAQTVARPDEVEDEIRHLIQALTR